MLSIFGESILLCIITFPLHPFHFIFYSTTPHINTQGNIVFNSVTFHLAFEYFQGDDQTDKIELQLEQLRLSSVEREFRKRIAEYNGGNSINGTGDSGSVRNFDWCR
jgi:hypothetical protein